MKHLATHVTITNLNVTKLISAETVSSNRSQNNPLRILASHELGVVDPSMGTKMTVQVARSAGQYYDNSFRQILLLFGEKWKSL
jgi:hypothetical protein